MGWVSRAIKVDTVQVSKKLRKGTDALFHWCAGCEEMHPLPASWQFNGNHDAPTFAPSFKHSWPAKPETGREEDICHYTITDGEIQYHSDCTHSLKDQKVPMADLPTDLCDEQFMARNTD